MKNRACRPLLIGLAIPCALFLHTALHCIGPVLSRRFIYYLLLLYLLICSSIFLSICQSAYLFDVCLPLYLSLSSFFTHKPPLATVRLAECYSPRPAPLSTYYYRVGRSMVYILITYSLTHMLCWSLRTYPGVVNW